ncbi:GFA family protein [Acidisphaera sp. L21]|uniref:GFA family protein n=1 Tax=Acidisphaera sp. L21 TaxID=1641851 RepID=UPI00131E4375|nr:GFA family protein [Acidisphaera sp. L21]
MHVDGQCHCGAIAYEAEVEPDTIAICHCLDCQRLSGAAFRSNVAAPAAGFRIVKGEPRHYIKTGESGAKRVHAFCATCGSPVYSSAVDNPQAYTLRVGALSQRDALGHPARQIWVKRRLPWVTTLGCVAEIDGQS